MILNEVITQNYRKFIKVELSFTDDITLLAGANNSGKTSLIDLLVCILESGKLYIAELLEEREQERERLERERQRKLEKMRKGELEEIRILQEAALDWNKAQDIRRFADHLETQINSITNETEKEKLITWLKWARDKADWLDPLTEKDDELLGKSRFLFDEILK